MSMVLLEEQNFSVGPSNSRLSPILSVWDYSNFDQKFTGSTHKHAPGTCKNNFSDFTFDIDSDALMINVGNEKGLENK